MYGDFEDKDARYAAVRRVPRDRPAAVGGGDRRLRGRRTSGSPARGSSRSPTRCREIYFGGSSPAAGVVAARHADVYLTWGEPPEAVAREDRVDPQARRRARGATRSARSRSGSGCTPSPATPPRRPGPRPTGSWPASTRRPSPRCRRGCGTASPRASAGCSPSTAAARTTSRSTPTSGPGSAWSAAAPARRSWAATSRWPTGSRSTTRSASTSSCSRPTRTSRAPTTSARVCCRSWPSEVCGTTPHRPPTTRPRSPSQMAGRAAS